ncbi:DNA-binding MarR family transcriptional regulator [Aeromicrobium panaciterrae]|uniref:DNA-binding MarR family transcriptional regulator n=1 Tax=Aeromicrobium panaciterrae TaxID=363861 RepID=A0ABU1UQ32_9ACTN|nr:MarR family winged helix-turn-helix transcriptional regulator [Aeromicrobium panaciterrae]MDR7087253.1 DNA-binding MarR family transcriptional regulator [Aeromicrobium panaciterrae]
MSRLEGRPDHEPLIAVVEHAARRLQDDMVAEGRSRGFPELRLAHNALFSTLSKPEGERSSDLAARARITKQAMGEVIRELVDLGILEMTPDPEDRRAKLVTYTKKGREFARGGFGHILDVEQSLIGLVGQEAFDTAIAVLGRIPEALAHISPAESPA